MRANVVGAEPLHSIIIYETIVHDVAHVLSDLLIGDCVRNKTKGDREAIAL